MTKRAPSPGELVKLDLSVMGLHELLHDGEADPGPVRVATGGTTEESLEDPLLFLEGNSRSGVCHLEIGVGLQRRERRDRPDPRAG